jgi:hypothetical protein
MSTEVCLHKEGYLMMYSDDDEVHLDLITEEHYKKIEAVWENLNLDQYSIAFEEEPLYRWFTQTRCVEPWPYNGVKILGTICVVRC